VFRPDTDEAVEDVSSLDKGVELSELIRFCRMLPNDGRAGIGLILSSNSSEGEGCCAFPRPNQDLFAGSFGEASSGTDGSEGIMAWPEAPSTTTVSSSKLTLTLFFFFRMAFVPSSDIIDVVPSEPSPGDMPRFQLPGMTSMGDRAWGDGE